jgi:D-erythro-7,8-dihydroneopterin triphosphate epimerase
MYDQIEIKDLHLRTVIGINDEERRDRQDVLINLVLFVELAATALSDNVEDSINYRTITKHVIRLVEDSRFRLVEKLATEIATLCLETDRIVGVRVSVEKPGALRFARSVGVTIERWRDRDRHIRQ